MKTKIGYIIALLLLASCSQRNLVYFSDLKEQDVYSEKIINNAEPQIQPGDILSITVNSLSPESNILFNKGGAVSPTADASILNASNKIKDEGYLVDESGAVDFPVLGKVMVTGLTAKEAKDKFVTQLSKYLKDPIVNVRFLNFKVTVIGEVNRPSTFEVPNGKVSVLEALGMAGDMTVYGKRENVLIVREKEGQRSMTRINLNNKEFLASPYFYLQQNDIVYVEPDKAKAAQANPNNRFIPIMVAAISALAIILTRFI
ncbi:polysaccharide biosynthesis/export family protein [Pontibacter fetidus]|uniref:Sugar transporter n=1 Tax=Pontibacter fetidus TaxID=2700082 RepID=A0A6B2HBZ7_9BACT|nr:polysaccharide biosynthesis/export family protein [Pontibacter fetidus]NDK57502.1 sugar transporter [Pontibacter fetidus]